MLGCWLATALRYREGSLSIPVKVVNVRQEIIIPGGLVGYPCA